MIIAIASGKGGTGKTTLSVALSSYISSKGVPVNLFDCDVDEPNVNLFIQADISVKETVYVPVPRVYKESCNGCGECEKICMFNAIVLIKGEPLVFPDLCHSCGGCMLVCPEKAIAETDKEIGTTEEGYIDNIQYVGGILRVREAITPPLIKAVKKHIMPDSINIIDAPPGTSCPVIESVQGCNYLVLVTEPTPFGLNDLVLAVNMARELGIPFGIVINRADIGDDRVVKYCNDEHIHIISQIPDSREIAERYSRGEFADFFIQNYPDVLEKILESAGIRTLETWRTQ